MTGALLAFIRLIFPSQKYMALHLLELPLPHSASLPNITPFQLSVANKTLLTVLPDLAVLAVVSAVVRLARIAALSFVRHAHACRHPLVCGDRLDLAMLAFLHCVAIHTFAGAHKWAAPRDTRRTTHVCRTSLTRRLDGDSCH